MPTETNRKIATKTFQTPAGPIKVPVITEITFRDTVDRGQETTYKIDNSAKAKRDVHVAWVGNGPTNLQATENADPNIPLPPGSSLIAVERIDLWRVKDTVERGQETFTKPDSKTYNVNGPPFFTTHLKTHVVNYRKDPTNPQDTVLVSSELIDEFVVKDPVDRGQETHFYLKNPKDDDAANAQITPDLPDITDTDNGVDPPYRTDPYQNIVKVTEQGMSFWFPYRIFQYTLPQGSISAFYHFYPFFEQGSQTAPNYPPSSSGVTADGQHFTFTGRPTVPDAGQFTLDQANPGGVFDPAFLIGPAWRTTLDGHAVGGINTVTATGPGASVTQSFPIYGVYNTGEANLLTAEMCVAGPFTFGGMTLVVGGVDWVLQSVSLTTEASVVNPTGFGPPYPSAVPDIALSFTVTFQPP